MEILKGGIMGIGYCKKTRRQFLVGSGKSLLVLPILPSLLPTEALAQAATPPRRLMSFTWGHNSINQNWPQTSLAATSVGTVGAREVLLRNLQSSQMGNVLSDSRFAALRAADQITIIRGFNHAFDGNVPHSNAVVAAGRGDNSAGNYPSFEAILEQSRTLYPASTPASVRRAIRVVHGDASSPFFQKVGSSVQRLSAYGRDFSAYDVGNRTNTLHTFYNDVFSSLTGGTTSPSSQTNALRTNILNRVFPAFSSFRNNRRISSDDRALLDQHMGFLSDLQTSFAQIPQTQNCTQPAQPGNYNYNQALYLPVYLDLLALAFRCGLTKVASMQIDGESQFVPGAQQYDDRPHLSIHGLPGESNGGIAAKAPIMRVLHNYYFNLIYDRFLTPLNVQEGATGRTYLDNMLTAWLSAGGVEGDTQGSGHGGWDSQQVLIGSMGGALRSGRFYRYPEVNGQWMPYNTMLITLMHLMGVPQADYAYATPDGRGVGYYGYGSGQPFQSRFYQPLSEILA